METLQEKLVWVLVNDEAFVTRKLQSLCQKHNASAIGSWKTKNTKKGMKRLFVVFGSVQAVHGFITELKSVL